VPSFCDRRFADDHPTAAGHFPGNPIIPGALLLDTVLDAIAGGRDATRATIRAVKFLRPVRPGDAIRIAWHDERGETHFQCSLIATQELVATGTLRLGIEPE
jgi:3-hydroxymyristoyl/3-hydroxydecanoyl-(acyl carrier protein) dehydratase